jgi:hypothetical protein
MSQSRLSAPGQAEARHSQLPLILLLNAYAVLGALFISRAILHALEISGRYWVGRQIFRATEPFARILELFPGGSSIITGQMTVADLTLVVGVVLFPIGILAFGGRGSSASA